MKKLKQIDIYGNEIDYKKVNIKTKVILLHGGRISKESKFRFVNGFRLGFYCKNCKNFKKNNCTLINKKIMKNDIACNLYEQKNKGGNLVEERSENE